MATTGAVAGACTVCVPPHPSGAELQEEEEEEEGGRQTGHKCLNGSAEMRLIRILNSEGLPPLPDSSEVRLDSSKLYELRFIIIFVQSLKHRKGFPIFYHACRLIKVGMIFEIVTSGKRIVSN